LSVLPDGNSAEAVHKGREHPLSDGYMDHLWIRVRDPAASKRFYTTIAPHAGLRLTPNEPGRVQLSGPAYSFSLVHDDRPLTQHVHIAFPARDDATVRAFHAAALAAGYEDHRGPGERAVYHPGYYGAFVLDPDGHNVEVVNHNHQGVVRVRRRNGVSGSRPLLCGARAGEPPPPRRRQPLVGVSRSARTAMPGSPRSDSSDRTDPTQLPESVGCKGAPEKHRSPPDRPKLSLDESDEGQEQNRRCESRDCEGLLI
jgi:catechol 2,3-dioxygenase-like lactoylglutathione lyase family enzyme